MIPPYERCPKRPSRLTGHEHIVVEDDTTFDGQMWMGWCKFCGASVWAANQEDHWHPWQFYVIREELGGDELLLTMSANEPKLSL